MTNREDRAIRDMRAKRAERALSVAEYRAKVAEEALEAIQDRVDAWMADAREDSSKETLSTYVVAREIRSILAGKIPSTSAKRLWGWKK